MLDLSGVLAPKEGRDIEVITREILDAKRRGRGGHPHHRPLPDRGQAGPPPRGMAALAQ